MQINFINASHLDGAAVRSERTAEGVNIDVHFHEEWLQAVADQIRRDGVTLKSSNGDGTVNLCAHPLLGGYLRLIGEYPDDETSTGSGVDWRQKIAQDPDAEARVKVLAGQICRQGAVDKRPSGEGEETLWVNGLVREWDQYLGFGRDANEHPDD